MSECYDCGCDECRCIFMLEVQEFVVGTGFIHFGYMNKLFKTREIAADYYNLYNPHMRDLNAHGNWCSDWDITDQVRVVVRVYHGEVLKINAYDEESILTINDVDNTISNKTYTGMILLYIDLWFTYFVKPLFTFIM